MNISKTIVIGCFGFLSVCSFSTFGKFQADEGIPAFIKVGETTKKEVFVRIRKCAVQNRSKRSK